MRLVDEAALLREPEDVRKSGWKSVGARRARRPQPARRAARRGSSTNISQATAMSGGVAGGRPWRPCDPSRPVESISPGMTFRRIGASYGVGLDDGCSGRGDKSRRCWSSCSRGKSGVARRTAPFGSMALRAIGSPFATGPFRQILDGLAAFAGCAVTDGRRSPTGSIRESHRSRL